MATITVTTLSELLKRLYAPWEIEQLVNLTYPVLEMGARKGTAQLGGDGFRFAVRLESAEGHAYIDEDQTLPTGLQSNVDQATVTPTVHAGVVQLTGLSMAVSSGDAMAFARSFDENVQQTIQAMAAYKEGAFFRDGTGVIGTFNGNPAAGVGPHTLDDVGFIREGMTLAVLDATDGTTWIHGSGGTNARIVVEAVDWPNRTITLTSAVPLDAGVDDNDTMYIGGSQAETTGTGPTSKEPIGLEGSLLASGTYLGISRTTFANWRANVLAVNSLFDEDVLLRARTRITQESGIQLQTMANSFAVITHPQQVDQLFKLAIPRIRYSANDVWDLGNASNVKFGGIEFYTSYNCPTDTAYMGDWQYSNSLYTPNGELHIDTEYNGSALKWVPTQDVGLVFAKEYHQFVIRKPNCFARLTGLTEPTR